jgi:hypothetical protein
MTLSPEKVHDFRISLLKESLEASKAEHANRLRDFTDLDTKAQSTTAIAGIFLAGSLAFYNGDALSTLIGFSRLPGMILLGVAVSMLVVSVVFSIRTMTIREIAAVDSVNANKAVDDLLRWPEDWSEGHERYLRDQIKDWQRANSDLSAKNDDKAKTVSKGQACLSLAVILVGLFLLILLLGAGIFPNRK